MWPSVTEQEYALTKEKNLVSKLLRDFLPNKCREKPCLIVIGDKRMSQGSFPTNTRR